MIANLEGDFMLMHQGWFALLRSINTSVARMTLSGHICRVNKVSQRDLDQMFTLMQRYYENVVRGEFESDFQEKDWVIVARDGLDGHIHGFSTQTLYSQRVGEETVRVLFSGDTIIDRKFWAKNPLAKMWGRLALSLIDAYPDESLYWFLISKGYKTYRFHPLLFYEFYPRYDVPTPDWAQQLIFKFASERFGPRFSETTGILKASEGGCRLREAIAEVTTDRLRNLHIAFFDRVNPNHHQGDELCCLAPLSRENFNRNAFRVIGLPHADTETPVLETIVTNLG